MVNITAIGGKLNILYDSTATEVIANIIIAVIILLAGFVLGRFVGKLVTRILNEVELDKTLKKITGLKTHLEKGAGLFLMYLIYFITVVMVLNQVGLTTTILHIVIGAVIILIILSVLIGIKDFIPNAFAGFLFFKKGNLKVGDVVKFKGLKGKIIKITLTEIVVETKEKESIYIPSSALSKNELVIVKKSKRK